MSDNFGYFLIQKYPYIASLHFILNHPRKTEKHFSAKPPQKLNISCEYSKKPSLCIHGVKTRQWKSACPAEVVKLWDTIWRCETSNKNTAQSHIKTGIWSRWWENIYNNCTAYSFQKTVTFTELILGWIKDTIKKNSLPMQVTLKSLATVTAVHLEGAFVKARIGR